MATYKVQSNGKAQSGLKTGDKVVTAGGTYKITGVNSDGSYKSEKVNNETTSTYKGSYANSGGGSSGGGSKGGSSSSGGGSSYSQYTAPTLGNTWNANTDYQAIINNAVANGDYVTAAKAEQLRNQKITATGSNYATTNNYKGWLNNTDYSTQMYEGMANGISAQEMQALYNGRYNKANGTIGLDQYKDDNLMQIAQNYINQQLALEQQQAMLDQWEADNPKEDYQSKYDPQIDALLSQILNREDFSYDAMNDPLYQQYAEMYQREGDRAMKETMAEAAAGAGGMNTYAMTAAMQANSYYNSQLNDRIPELYQLAYNMYLNDKESKVQDLGILQNMDATQYNRYRDTINDWYNDKNFAYGAYKDAVQQGNWQTNHNYNSYWDNKNYDTEQAWKNKEWDYNDMWTNKEYTDNRADIEYERNQAEEEEAKAEIKWYIENGVTSIPSDLIKKSGLDQNAINQMIANYQLEQASNGTSSSSKKKTEDYTYDPDDGKNPDDNPDYTPKPAPTSENYTKVAQKCDEMASSGDKWAAAAVAKEALDNEYITQEEYNSLLKKYNPLLDVVLGVDTFQPSNVFGLK